jgi:hypothetical protein
VEEGEGEGEEEEEEAMLGLEMASRLGDGLKKEKVGRSWAE